MLRFSRDRRQTTRSQIWEIMSTEKSVEVQESKECYCEQILAPKKQEADIKTSRPEIAIFWKHMKITMKVGVSEALEK